MKRPVRSRPGTATTKSFRTKSPFSTCWEVPIRVTGDRTEFIGRNGNTRMPAAMRRVDLSGQTGAGFDPCGAVQKKLKLLPGQELEVIFLLGWTDGTKSVADVLSAYRTRDHVHQAIEQTIRFWADTSQTIEVQNAKPLVRLAG